AGAAAVALLAAFWWAYDALCRIAGPAGSGLKLGLGVTALVLLSAWGTSQLFAGRAAFLLTGAMIATAMSANVFFWIIPGQRKVVAAIQAGQPVDPVHGQRGKQRSVHNTYLTLPVLIAMLSNHYGQLYSHPHNWLVLVLLMLAGALIRHFFVARHKTHRDGLAAPWGWALAGCAPLVVLIVWLAPWQAIRRASAAPVTFAQVQAVIQARCMLCHNAQVQQKGVALHTPELIAKHAAAIHTQAVLQRTMPLNNATQITEDERALLHRWFEAGARTD
ncbi:MAG: urate hydroxylase PuuD, partial [Burkholderiales bacterium]|nr:urate hydroxylase PuuD [Burkholderiales bacterium]